MRPTVFVSLLLLLGMAAAPGVASGGRVYVGGGVGHAHVRNEITIRSLDFPASASFDALGGAGPLVGLLMGYEIERGVLRFAVEADYSASDVWVSLDAYALGDGGEVRLAAEHTLILALRPGCELADGVVLFGRVGYGYTQYSSFLRSDLEPYDTQESSSGEAQLIALGLGVEAALRDGLALRGDYTYHAYQDASEREDGLALAMRSNIYAARLSFVYRF